MNEQIKEEIAALARKFYPEVKAVREHLHANPELSFEEFETHNFVCAELDRLNIPYQANFGGTGVVAWIQGSHASGTPFIALRADLDALPIEEKNQVDYRSQNPGVMHACGHDVHTSVLLGTAKILKSLEAKLTHPVLLVFQPGEEKAPGGASILIREGLFEKWKVAKMFGLHVHPEMDAGRVGFKSGLYMASCDEIHVQIEGKGGHAAMPHLCTDVVQAGSELVRDLPLLLHRKCDPKVPMVLSFGYFEARGSTNVLPDCAHIKGTFRTMDEKWREDALNWMKSYSLSLSEATGTKVELTVVKGYPYLENNPEVTEELRSKAQFQLGDEQVEELTIRMTAEDFSFYTHHVPCSFFRLGVRNEKRGIIHGVHHSQFDIDPTALLVGMQVMSQTAFD